MSIAMLGKDWVESERDRVDSERTPDLHEELAWVLEKAVKELYYNWSSP